MNTNLKRYSIFGFCFGLCFPIISILIDGLLIRNLLLDWQMIFDLHRQNPLHYIIDTAPVFLGLSFGFAGHYLDEAKKDITNQQLFLGNAQLKSIQKLRAAYIFAILSIAILLIASQFLIQIYIKRQQGTAHLIDMAGRQRMLSQKIIRQASNVLFANPENSDLIEMLKINRNTFELHQNKLMGSVDEEVFGANYTPSVATKHIFEKSAPLYANFIKNVDSIIFYAQKKDEKINKAYLQKFLFDIIDTEVVLFPLIEKAVVTYKEDANEKLSMLKNIELTIILISLFILGFEAFFIFRPAINGAEKSTKNAIIINQKLLNTNESLLESQKELQTKIDALKKSQEKLSLSEAKNSAIVKAIPDLLFIVDKNFRFIDYLGGKAEDLFLPQEAFLNRRFVDIFPKKYVQFFEKLVLDAINTDETLSMEYDMFLNQSTKYFEARASKIESVNDEATVLFLVRNITDKKMAEIHIRQQNERLLNSEKMLQMNLAELQLTKDLLEEKTVNLELAMNDIQAAQSQLLQNEKMNTLGQLVASISHEINSPLSAINSTTISTENVIGEIPQMMRFFKNIPEQSLVIFNQILKKAAEPQKTLSTKEKRFIKYDLVEKLENYELKNAESIADMLLDLNLHADFEFIQQIFAQENAAELIDSAFKITALTRGNLLIKTATARASKIIYTLKNFVRNGDGDVKQRCDVNENIETTLVLYQNIINQGIEVTKKFATLPQIEAFSDELVQVWTNLVHNAIQAMNGKGKIDIETKMEEKNIIVSITDNGHGIPTEVRDKIFNQYFTTKKAGEGTGLGLDITKKIIEKHGGTIWFESEIGSGTTFFVKLPV